MTKQQNLSIFALIAALVTTIILIGLRGDLVALWREWIEILTDQEAIQEWIRGTGYLAPVAFTLIQALQVILAPVPGAVTGLASGYLFGAFWGSVITQLGITIGALVAFWLAKRFGRPLVERLVPVSTLRQLDSVTQKRGTSGLFLIFILPFLPDDAVCFLAGLTPIDYRQFLLLVTIGRTPSSVVSSLTGAGLVQLSPVGWAVFAVLALIAAYLVFRYENQLREFFFDRL